MPTSAFVAVLRECSMPSSRKLHRFVNSGAELFEYGGVNCLYYVTDLLFHYAFQTTIRFEMTSRAALHLLRQRQCVCLLTRPHSLSAGSASVTSMHINPSLTSTFVPSTRFKSTTHKTSTPPEVAGKKSQTKATSTRKKAAKESAGSKKETIPDGKSGIPKGVSTQIDLAQNEIGAFPEAQKSTSQKTSTPEVAGKKSKTKTTSTRKKAAIESAEAKSEKSPDEKSGIPNLSGLITTKRNEKGCFPVAHKVSELIRR